MDPAQANLAGLFLQTLDVKSETRRAATNALMDGERTAGFTMTLLRLAGNPGFELKVRLLASTHFKNVVKRNWNEPEPAVIPAEDRKTIKEHLVGLMTSVPNLVQRQLSEALSIISRRDFPAEWPNLLPDLVTRLNTTDLNVLVGVLETAASIFERFRNVPDNDDVRKEIRYSLDAFGSSLGGVMQTLSKMLDDATARGEGKANTTPLLVAIKLVVSIYHSLSWLELPDIFEDAMAQWMTAFRKFLTYSNPAIEAKEGDTEEGPVESMQAAVLDVIALLADKYDEEFEAFFPTFAGDVWTLLSGSSSSRIMAECVDPLVIRAVKFLTASVSNSVHVAFFKSPGILPALIERVIVTNIRLRQSDLETFEDNPIEFLRKDIEGSDTDTRRRVAADLVRALCKQFEGEATAALLACIDGMLKTYSATVAAGGAGNDLDKDAAIALLIAVAVKTQVSLLGVTGMNPLVDLGAYLTSHILPELSAAATNPENVNAQPIVKAACLKFVTTFRAQFTREQLLALLPMVVPFAGANSYVVHTYAANCVEKILTIKDKVAKPGSVGPVPQTILQSRLSVADLSPHMTPLFSGLFALMARTDYPENDYMMRACMRVVAFEGPAVAPFARQVISGLTIILGRVCANPSNPTFNHFLFETIACIMKNCVPAADAAAGAAGAAASPSPAVAAAADGSTAVTVADFETMLFPPFQAVLSADVAEFQPYVFQLMALLLELRPTPNAGEHAITAGFQSLLPPLLTAEAWKRPGNVPALTMLMQAYLRRGATYLHPSGNLVPLLGVWQNLLATKNQEEYSFDILTALYEGCPLEVFGGFMQTICQYLCQKLQDSKSAKIARLFTHSSAFFVGLHGVGVLEAAFNSLQQGLFFQMLENVMLPQAPHVFGGKEAKQEAAVGFTRMLSEVPSIVQDPAKASTLNTLITVIVELLEPASSANVVVGASSTYFEEKDTGDLVEEAVQGEYSAAFAKLLFAQDKNRYAFKRMVPDPKAFFARALVAASNTVPGKLPALMKANPAANTVQRYLTAAGVALA